MSKKATLLLISVLVSGLVIVGSAFAKKIMVYEIRLLSLVSNALKIPERALYQIRNRIAV